jgi:rifampin ADP-ribosylating transferase
MMAITRRVPMASKDDMNRGSPPANSGRFVVSHPCNGCHGQGQVSGQPCPTCHGTGAERLFHGTKADLKPGDLIEPGHRANFGNQDRTTTHVYLTATLDAATWGAELAVGEGWGRIYIVEPTGTLEEDPNLTDKKFPGNPTRSYRSREALRVMGEVVDWRGHDPAEVKAMKEGVERSRQQGVEPID